MSKHWWKYKREVEKAVRWEVYTNAADWEWEDAEINKSAKPIKGKRLNRIVHELSGLAYPAWDNEGELRLTRCPLYFILGFLIGGEMEYSEYRDRTLSTQKEALFRNDLSYFIWRRTDEDGYVQHGFVCVPLAR